MRVFLQSLVRCNTLCHHDRMSQMHDQSELEWTLNDRLHKALRISGMNATSMADALGVHRNTVNNYLTEKSPIDRRTLIAWAFATGVPFEWLETGASSHAVPPGDGGSMTTARYAHYVTAA